LERCGAITDQTLRPPLDHAGINCHLHRHDLLVAGSVFRDHEQHAVAIDNRHNLHVFSAFRRPDLIAATLGQGEARANGAFRFVDRAICTQCARQLGQSDIGHCASSIRNTH